MKIEEFDKIMLKDGRTGYIVEILEENVAYLMDVDLPDNEYDTIGVKYEDIKAVLA